MSLGQFLLHRVSNLISDILTHIKWRYGSAVCSPSVIDELDSFDDTGRRIPRDEMHMPVSLMHMKEICQPHIVHKFGLP